MPAPLSKLALLHRIREAVYASGWRLLYEDDSSIHPFRLRVFENERQFSIAVYIWSLTHGGGAARPRNEYRIQMTGIDFPLASSPDFKTLLLGWNENLGVFAGFDVTRHRISQSRSPSVQIYFETLQEAQQHTFAFQRKGNNEIAVAFSPELFGEYVAQQEVLHGFAGDARGLKALEIATTEEAVPDELIDALPAKRQIAVRTIAVRSRSRTFRERVIKAYERYCAICDMQLDLLEAAHIIPVSSNESNDLTSNGIALCHRHHEAYDASLIGVNEKYQIILNKAQIRRLEQRKLLGGLERFLSELRSEIRLPASEAIRPRPEYLMRGLQLRGW